MHDNGTPFRFTLSAIDPDGAHTLTWSTADLPLHGSASASGIGPSVTVSYIPQPDYVGSDTFTVTVSDGAGGTDTAQVNIVVAPNQAPRLTQLASLRRKSANNAAILTYEDILAASDATDSDGDSISFLLESVLNGTLIKNGVIVGAGTTYLHAGESLQWQWPSLRAHAKIT